MKPPYVPEIDNSLDLKNIDRMFTREAPRETPIEESILLKKSKFDGFTYVEESNLNTNNDNSYGEINWGVHTT